MPYGISKEYGGDSPENVKKMESCVEQVMGGHKKMSKSMAIAICKSSIFNDDSEVEDESEEKED